MGPGGNQRRQDENGRTILKDIQVEYVDWLLTPKPERNPSTKIKFAESIGVHVRTLYDWEKDVHVRAAIQERAQDFNIGPERIQDIINNMWRKAASETDPKAVEAAKLYLEFTKQFIPTQRHITEDASIESLTDQEVAEIALAEVRPIREA